MELREGRWMCPDAQSIGLTVKRDSNRVITVISVHIEFMGGLSNAGLDASGSGNCPKTPLELLQEDEDWQHVFF